MTDVVLKIDNELKSYIPALSAEEYALLEESILSEGCRDPIVVWGGFVLDGHNRYEICHKHNKPFQTIEKVGLKTKDDVKVWMIKNQIGRRNLTDFQRTELALRLKPLLEKKAKENQVANLKKGVESPVLPNSAKRENDRINTTEEIAKSAGVGKDTVQKVEKILAKADPEIIEKARSGEISINAAANTIGAGKPPKQEDDIQEQLRPNSDEAGKEDIPVSSLSDEQERIVQSDDDAFSDGPTLEELVDQLSKENEQLQQKIQSLTVSDKDAELLKKNELIFSYEQRINTLTTEVGAAKNQARYVTDKLREIGKIVGTEDWSEIISAVRRLKS